jgi:hypothetical protein
MEGELARIVVEAVIAVLSYVLGRRRGANGAKRPPDVQR